MTKKIISGIQQIGIGVTSLKEAWKWYKSNFGVDIRIFEEAAPAEYMLRYTGGKSRNRRAALAINLMGGGGFEIWQYTERTPQPPVDVVKIGDYGIFAAKIKSPDVKAVYKSYKEKDLNISDLLIDPNGKPHFFVTDPFDNIFQVIESDEWFHFDRKKLTGATAGAIIGVSDIEKARKVYSNILGYDKVVYDKEDIYDDLSSLNGGKSKLRRVLLKQTKKRIGAFAPLMGSAEIELIQNLNGSAVKIFRDRYWGDLGFIHLCYDINGMAALREECKNEGHSFTVDSADHPEGESFDIGEAAGHFAYIEDPDGTLIEFVETHKVPVMKKLGWYLNLRKRKPEKSLPIWILKALKFNKISDKQLS